MFVCLCNGVTSDTVNRVVAAGATTSKQVADACGAGTECGRCKRTVRAIIDSFERHDDAPSVKRY